MNRICILVTHILFCFRTLIAFCFTVFCKEITVSRAYRIVYGNWVTGAMLRLYQLASLMLTFDGPSLIFFIWSLYFISSASIRAIFLSRDSILPSTYNGPSNSIHIMYVWHQDITFFCKPLHKSNLLTLPMQSDRLGVGVCLLRPKSRFIFNGTNIFLWLVKIFKCRVSHRACSGCPENKKHNKSHCRLHWFPDKLYLPF